MVESKDELRTTVQQWLNEHFDTIYETYVSSIENIDRYGKKLVESQPDESTQRSLLNRRMADESRRNDALPVLQSMTYERYRYWMDQYHERGVHDKK